MDEEKLEDGKLTNEETETNVAGNDVDVDVEKSEPQNGQSQLSKILSRVSRTSRKSQRRDPDFVVKFDQNDLDNPRAFSSIHKALITLQLGLLALTGSITSSIISPAEPAISAYIDVGQEVTVLVVALYILGFAFGVCLPGSPFQS